MSRASIDVGIDLGTTNSSIAFVQRGRAFVIPNNRGQHLTPSVVRISKDGAVRVGQAALSGLMIDPDNTASEFKRLMGLPEERRFPASSRTMTPEELSAEVLRSLLGDLEGYAGQPFRSAVITVPAAFDLNQCAATEKAARMAGLSYVELLQEPIAASLAFGARLDLDGKSWLSYDLGGGTFDLALVTVVDDSVKVIDHEGDNHLGGRDFDRAFLGEVVLPHLASRYAIASIQEGAPERVHDLARLRLLTEELKIELSRSEDAVLTIESGGQPILDDRGEPIDIDIRVRREELERAIEPLVGRTLVLADDLLKRHSSLTVEAVLMVGGPTQSPFVRERVATALGLRVDTSANPGTVVAEGAALYAAARRYVGDEESESAVPAGVHALQLSVPGVTNQEDVLAGVRVPVGTQTVEFRTTDGGWTSGRIPSDRELVTHRLPLIEQGGNEFEIELRDSAGATIPVVPSTFSVTRGLVADAAPLSKSLGVIIEDDGGVEGATTFALIPKNTPLPATGRHEFRTTVALRPGVATPAIHVHIVEGEGSRPDRNRRVADIVISGEGVSREIPAGNPLEVSISIDESRMLSADAYLPLIDESFPAQVKLEHDDAGAREIQARVAAERERLQSLTGDVPATLVRQLHDQLDEAFQNVAAVAPGADEMAAALRDVQQVELRLDQIERTREVPQAEADARRQSELTSEVVMEFGDSTQQARWRALSEELERAVETGASRELRQVEQRLSRLRFESLSDHPMFWAQYFQYLKTRNDWLDSARATSLIREGDNALQREEFTDLTEVVRSLVLLLPDDESPWGEIGLALR